MTVIRNAYPLYLAVVLCLSVLLTGCETEPPVNPFDEEGSTADTFHELREFIRSDITSVEVRIIPGTVTASRVRVERPDDTLDRERIRSRATALDAGENAGTLTLILGGMRIEFNGATRFRDGDGNDLSFKQFIEHVQSALAAGIFPGIDARREAADIPQHPDDPTFTATRISLRDNGEDSEDRIRFNITGANMLTNDSPPPDGWIVILGVPIEIRASEGITRLRIR